MPSYRKVGSIPAKRHTAHRAEPGFKNEGIYYEEVVTTAGFGRAYSIVYHLRPPTRVKNIEAAGSIVPDIVEQPVLRHHHLKTGGIPVAGDPLTGRVPLMLNADVTLARCRPAQRQNELYRNADADEVIFIHHGDGKLGWRNVKLGAQAGDWVEVAEGLKEGDHIVTSANFLIDSESQLKAAVGGMKGMKH